MLGLVAEILTEAGVKGLVVPDGGRVEISDVRCPGLRLRASATAKAWYFVGATPGSAKVARVKLGRWPSMNLATARRRADDTRGALADSTAALARQGAASALTFGDLAARYIEQAKRRKKSWRNDEYHLKRATAALGARRASSLTRKDFTDLLHAVAETAPVSANRMQTTLRTLLAHAVDDGLLPANPLAGARKIGGREISKDRVLSDTELVALWRALEEDAAPAALTIRLALKTILLTCARPGEVAGMRRRELDLDGTKPTWLLPGERTKNGRAHLIPLSEMAVETITAAMAATDAIGAGEFVFVSRYETTEPIARHSLSQATRRLCMHDWLAAFTPHDLRRTGATLARAEGVPRDSVVELLNHVRDDATSIYDCHSMQAEKQDAVDRIAIRLKRIVAAKADENRR